MTTAITPVGAHSSAPVVSAKQAASAPTAVNSLSYDDFLTLLISELKHQDPTAPMDPTAMVSQLATVSQVGQSVLANKHLTSLLNVTSFNQAENMIGRTVTSPDGATRGVVASVNVSDAGPIATLVDGRTVDLTSGATIQ